MDLLAIAITYALIFIVWNSKKWLSGKEKPEPKNLSTSNRVSTAEPKAARPSDAVKSPLVSPPRAKARPSDAVKSPFVSTPRAKARPSVAVTSPKVSTPRVKARPSAVTRTKSREAHRVSPFQSRINKTGKAISSGKLISFNYTNLDGIESVRSIKPYFIKHLEDGAYFSQCVHGYCYLREENRTFAIARMRSIKIDNSPIEGYHKKHKPSKF